ncbi:MAG: LD-carboxypeptidase [Defluviitaleaceae bacterium]|nr:LD-carboxypeptidase [Defluviitaleaceae bacterium]
MLIKPHRLKKGDTVAIVSLSSGLGGHPAFTHRYEIGKSRLETEFGLNVITMPNALKGIEYLDNNPQARAADLMDAFKDDTIKAIICMIGGNDTVRLLNYINFDTIRQNPKIFMGYSDTTSNHFMMQKAGLVSFYGPCILAEFAENVAMHEYTKHYIQNVLFQPSDELAINPSPAWTSEFLEWADPTNNKIARTMTKDDKGYELLQGEGIAQGRLLGGCIDVFPMIIGTKIWPNPDEWDNAILFLETSQEYPAPHDVKYILRGLAAQGIISRLGGILFGKPQHEKYYEEYKQVLLQVVGKESGRHDMPILYNVNFGHTAPICILPYGVMAEINSDNKSLRLLEAAVV